MEVLKIATAGSVDDGKSTLIGRLLYDTKSLTDDKIEAIKKSSKKKGFDYLDFSLATDGLVAEREQGITIDVAHIYFSTEKKSYIIADTPGHVEYTRNMVTGASNAQASIILIDARNGVIEQTKRHFFINNLLRVKHIIVAVNKMDLVDYNEDVFNAIKSDFEALNGKSTFNKQQITFIPISALEGENVVTHSEKTNWYSGPTVLSYLEGLKAEETYQKSNFRFPVQTVIRPKQDAYHDYRGYAGKVYGDSVKVGDKVTVLPSLKESKVKEIQFFDGTFSEVNEGASVTIQLEDDINVSRGDTIVKTNEVPNSSKELEATICWMDTKKLAQGTKYLIQHNTNIVLSKVDKVAHTVATDYSGIEEVNELGLNDIGKVSFKLSKSLFYDSYHENKSNGSFILIDAQTNTTAGVGFID
ncbi:sulfate adenylyltransferase subunit 1 [Pseudofulvibacter geojedonensis]|uniref:sulfate adenylyltransferase n=1 Tax=Pseudofulvibacter geojedonensis TaxID=1123758 RepID=A0ABW3I509_9FLAO